MNQRHIGLVSNAGASPAGVHYTVVYQLGPGEVKTEFWLVPTTSPANLATVRTTPGSGVAGQAVSMQYVNSALAAKADDSSVVHVNGTETISGTKTLRARRTFRLRQVLDKLRARAMWMRWRTWKREIICPPRAER